MVTATDLTDQLGQFAGPFLFVGEIEGHLRNLIHGKFTLEELQAASTGENRPIEGSSDLTFGGFCRLLENADNWERSASRHRSSGVHQAHLNAVREMRNDVMHFNPDGLGGDQREKFSGTSRVSSISWLAWS